VDRLRAVDVSAWCEGQHDDPTGCLVEVEHGAPRANAQAVVGTALEVDHVAMAGGRVAIQGREDSSGQTGIPAV
jgi:hypothetical protein